MGSITCRKRYRVRVAAWLLGCFLISIGSISVLTACPELQAGRTELPAPTPLNEEEVKHARTIILDGLCFGPVAPLMELPRTMDEDYLPSPCGDVLERPPKQLV